MARASPIQTSVNAGEMSAKLDGRVDIERRAAGLQFGENVIPEVYGGGQRRSGSRFVAPARDSDKFVRLIDFRYSTEQAYVLELGEGYMRFYRNHAPLLEAAKNITGATQANPVVLTINAHGYQNGQDVEVAAVLGMTQLNNRRFRAANVAANTFELQDQFGNPIDGTAFGAYVSGGVAARVYTIATPYLEADLPKLKYTQSNDALYIAHPNYVPRKLLRLAAVQWTLLQLDFIDGPYLAANPGNATLQPSATSGAGITISSPSATVITNCANNGTGLIRVTSAAHGKQWPDFSYTNRRPDDLTITVLAATYLNFMPARDLGRAGWHLGELQPTWISANADSGFSRSIGDSKDALVREGKKYACEDLVKFGYALAEHELSENYWTRRMVREGFLSERPWQQKAELSARAGKNISGDLRRIARLESSLVRAIDSAQYAQR